MSIQSRVTIKGWFETGDMPTQTQFSDTWDSFVHLTENANILGCKVYDPTLTYAQGQLVTYGGAGYIANLDIVVPEAWTASHWTLLVSDSSMPIKVSAITGDGLLLNVGLGHMLQEIHAVPTGGTPTLRLGTTAGGDDIMTDTELTPGLINALKDLDYASGSTAAAFDIYVSGTWDGASIDFYVTEKRLF